MRSPKRILLLGDEFRVIQLVRQTLANTGRYLLKEEQNSRAAFQTVRLFRPDVIFLGLGTDGLKWNTTLQEIKTDIAFKTTPILTLMSADSSGSIRYGGSISGYDFSVQPMTIEELIRSVEELLKVD